jgi:hypothetical protein
MNHFEFHPSLLEVGCLAMTTDGISPFRNIYLGDSTVIGIIMYDAAFKWKTWLHKFLCECCSSIFFQLLLITKNMAT